MEESEKINDELSPAIFVDADGEALQFSVRGSEKHFKSTIEQIQKGNGVVTVRRNGPFTILLDQPTSRIFGEEEVFSVNFISDCCESKALLDLNKYRLNKNSKYQKDFDANQVLLKKVCWSDVPLDSTTTTSKDSLDTISHRSLNVFKNVARPYMEKERLAIINYIIEEKAYAYVGGNSLWMEMEKHKVCEGRTWQSLKNHFKKTILPQIGSYGLNEKILKKFKERRR